MIKDPHLKTTKEILKEFSIREDFGLSLRQVIENRKKYGRNKELIPKPTFFKELKELVKTKRFLFRILCCLLFFIATIIVESSDLFYESILGFLLIIISVVYQSFEQKEINKNLRKQEKKLSSKYIVTRAAQTYSIEKRDLSVGDVVHLYPGKEAPCDVRIIRIYSSTFVVDQSKIFASEGQNEVKKQTGAIPNKVKEPENYSNICYSGSYILFGRAKGIVLAMGADSFVSKMGEESIYSTKQIFLENQKENEPVLNKIKNVLSFFTSYFLILSIVIVAVLLFPHLTGEQNQYLNQKNCKYIQFLITLFHVSLLYQDLAFELTALLKNAKMRLFNLFLINFSIRDGLKIFYLFSSLFPNILITNFRKIFTSNEMTVKRIFYLHSNGKFKICQAKDTKYEPVGKLSTYPNDRVIDYSINEICLRKLGLIASLCNNAALFYSKKEIQNDNMDKLSNQGLNNTATPTTATANSNGNNITNTEISEMINNDYDEEEIYDKIGKPIEAALLVMSEKIGAPRGIDNRIQREIPSGERVAFARNCWSKKYEVLYTEEYDKNRKLMSTLVHNKTLVHENKINEILNQKKEENEKENVNEQEYTLLVKGALNQILESSDKILFSDGKISKLTQNLKLKIKKKAKEFSTEGLTMMGFAYRDQFNENPLNADLHFLENGLVFVAATGIEDKINSKEISENLDTIVQSGMNCLAIITGETTDSIKGMTKDIPIFQNTFIIDNDDLININNDGNLINKNNKRNDQKNELKKVLINLNQGKSKNDEKIKIILITNSNKETKKIFLNAISDFKKNNKNKNKIMTLESDLTNLDSIKKSTISLSLGKTGSDLLKNNTDLILYNESLKGITDALEQFTKVFSNVRGWVGFNISFIISLFLITILSKFFHFQIFNFTQIFLLIVLKKLLISRLDIFNLTEKNIFQKIHSKKLRSQGKGKPLIWSWSSFSHHLFSSIFIFCITVSGIIYYLAMYEYGPQLSFTHILDETAILNAINDGYPITTFALTLFFFIHCLRSLLMFSEFQSIFMSIFSNILVLTPVFLMAVTLLIFQKISLLQKFFSLSKLPIEDCALVIIFSLIIIVFEEIIKFFKFILNKI
ncbi:calcium-transporting atpase [Anaeramoeba flamelloides]|uniref:Calcium-transporting atpase n=1 Tax=Anaeramoeba flamelloides TaxID=1746091 RepID=A0ABQ8YJF6_9EUKA|nr:calcium-transporting atpase [Anaeramoeba flamelloides]